MPAARTVGPRAKTGGGICKLGPEGATWRKEGEGGQGGIGEGFGMVFSHEFKSEMAWNRLGF